MDVVVSPEFRRLLSKLTRCQDSRSQEQIFRSRRSALEGELRIVRESVRGLETQLQSLEQLRLGREKQVTLFREQLDSFRKLSTQGFVSRNHLLDQERQLSEVQSKQSEDLSNIAGITLPAGAGRDTGRPNRPSVMSSVIMPAK